MGTIDLRHQMLQRLTSWAESSPSIQAAAVVGSGARQDHPADEWSDIDLILVVDRPTDYLDQTAWCGEIAEPWVQTVEQAENGQIVERRVLFRSGLDVDFIVLDGQDPQALAQEPFASIMRRGLRVLVDKRGIFNPIPAQAASAAPSPAPSPEAFNELVSDFWFHAVWTAKKIKRGELWTAKSCCDIYMKRLLLRMIEWHAACLSNRPTWYSGRFIEQWAAPVVLERLPGIFATYAEDSVWQALRNTMDLFDILARELAAQMAAPYNEEVSKGIHDWVINRLRGFCAAKPHKINALYPYRFIITLSTKPRYWRRLMGGSNGSFATAPDQVLPKNTLPARFWHFSQKNLLAVAFVLLASFSTAVIGYLKADTLLSWLYTGDLFSFDTVLQETLRGHIGLEFTYCNTFGDHAYFFLLLLAPLKFILSSKMLYLLVQLGPLVYLGSSILFFFAIKQIAPPWKAFLIALVFLLGFGQTYPGLYEKLYGMHPDTFAGYLLAALAALLIWKEASEARGQDSRPQTAGAVILLLAFLCLKEEMALLAILFFAVACFFQRSPFHRNMALLSAGVFGVDLLVMALARTPFNRTNNSIIDAFIKNFLSSGFQFFFNNPEVEPKALQAFWLAIVLGCLLFCAAAVLSRRVHPYSLGLLAAGLAKMAFGTALADFSLITWHNFPGLVMITAAVLIQLLFVVKIKSPYQVGALALLAGVSLFCFLSADVPFTREHLIDQTQRKIEMSGYHKELSQFINQVNQTQVMSIPEFAVKRFIGYRYVFYPRGVSESPAGIADFVIYPLGNKAQGLKYGYIQETPPPELLKSFSEVARTPNFILFKRTALSASEKATRAACLPYSAP